MAFRYDEVMRTGSLCVNGTETGCVLRKQTILQLEVEAMAAKQASLTCSMDNSLDEAQRDWYRRRASLWGTLVHDMESKPDGLTGAYTVPSGVQAGYLGLTAPATVAMPKPDYVEPATYDGICKYAYSDCDWSYTLIGGVEQSDLSAQASQTTGFIDLIVRAPVNVRAGSIWLQARFLGAPNNSNTQGVVAAATDPTGAITATSLSSVGSAVDYVVGLEHDWFQPNKGNPARGMFTAGFVLGFGATTPLSSLNATAAFAMPLPSTPECDQLHQRFSIANGYAVPLPGTDVVTTTTTVGSLPPVVSTATFCAVSPAASSSTASTNGVKISVSSPTSGITNIAFTPEDRSSFLLKYGAGIRLITRFHSGGSNRCSSASAGDRSPTDSPNVVNGPCTRDVVDFSIGQDQAITGGSWRHFVFKSDAIFPILQTGVYFFGSAAIRIEKKVVRNPLVLTPTQVSSSAGTSTVGSVNLPSPAVFVLPLKQSDRDFYRVGIGLDLSKVLPKLFTKH